MIKRLLDILLSSLALVALAPVFLLTALAILVEDGRPILFRATRAGVGGMPITVYKFRTMHQGADKSASVSAARDPRVLSTGRFLRKAKLDELPQLWNVLRGDMSIVGPRPEDIDVVKARFQPEHMHTLDVRPGLASPGSIYNYTHGEALLNSNDFESVYLEQVLPTKLALESVYVKRMSVMYDIRIIGRTLKAIVLVLVGRPTNEEPPEMQEAREHFLVPMRLSDNR